MVLGISVGTRLCGTAVLSGTELIHWHTHTFREAWSEEKAQAIHDAIEEYFSFYKVSKVLIKIPPRNTHSFGITSVLKKLTELFAYHGCMVQVHTKSEIMKVAPEIRTSAELMTYLTEQYSTLIPESESERANKRPYHEKMFEAVLMAHLQKREAFELLKGSAGASAPPFR